MKTARLFAPKDIRIVESSMPALAGNEILCKVVRAGICSTDYSIFSRDAFFVKNGRVKFPLTLGHEWSGVVEKIGSGRRYLKPGDRVVGDTAVSCGICYKCFLRRYFNTEHYGKVKIMIDTA